MPTSQPSPATPPKPVLFLDRDLGNTILARALLDAGYPVEPFSKHFKKQSTLDVEWFPYVAERGWIALSKNWRQRYQSDERDMVMRTGLALFHIINPGNYTEFAPKLVAAAPKIIEFRERHDAPFMANVYRVGRVRMSLTFAEWQRMTRERG